MSITNNSNFPTNNNGNDNNNNSKLLQMIKISKDSNKG